MLLKNYTDNYAKFSLAKNAEIMLNLLFNYFYLCKTSQKLCNKRSEWQTPLPLLHQETLRVHGNSLSEDYKTLNN